MKKLEYTNTNKINKWVNDTSANVVSGEVVPLTDFLGIAAEDIADGDTGVLYIQGQFRLPKQSALAISAGVKVYFDTTAKEIDTTNTNVYAGVAMEDAGASNTTILVNLNFPTV